MTLEHNNNNNNNNNENENIIHEDLDNSSTQLKRSEMENNKNHIQNSNSSINIIDDSKNNYLKSKKKKKLHYTPPHIIRNKNVQRYISLAWGILTILISGTLYGFSIISNEVRDILDYNQTKIGAAISIGDVGIYLGLTVGYFYDIFGSFYTMLLATSLYILGYMGVWGIVNGSLNSNFYLLSFFLFLVGQGSHASFTGSIVPNVHNFTIRHRGKISGILVGCFALSSGLFGIIYKSTFRKNNDVLGYLLFLAILLSSISFIGSFLIRIVKISGVNDDDDHIQDDDDNTIGVENYDEDNFTEKLKNSISTDSFNSGGSDIENIKNDISLDTSGSSIGGAKNNDNNNNNSSSDLSSSIKESSDNVVTKKNEGKFNLFINNITKSTNHSDYHKLIDNNHKHDNNNNNNNFEDFDNENSQNLQNQLNPNYLDGKRDISGLQLLKTLEFWLMWIVYFFAAGNSLMFLNNLAAMGESLKKDSSLHSDLVIVFAVCNLVGRTLVGFISDFISKKYSRFWCVIMGSTIISITHLATALDLDGMLIPGTVLTAIGYGFMVSIMVSLTTLRFGQRRFGINFGFLAIASASASLLFGTVSGKIYDLKSEKNEKCYGTHCFQLVFILSFILNFICIFITGFLIFYLRKQQLKKYNK